MTHREAPECYSVDVHAAVLGSAESPVISVAYQLAVWDPGDPAEPGGRSGPQSLSKH